MRSVALADLERNAAAYVDECQQEPVFVTRDGGVVAVLEHVTDDDVEDFLLERSPRFQQALDAARQQPGGMSLAEYRASRGL